MHTCRSYPSSQASKSFASQIQGRHQNQGGHASERKCRYVSDVHMECYRRSDLPTLAPSITVNKQLNDKERVQAALENAHLLGVVEGCLSTTTQSSSKA
jgi:hypothetical protein